MCSKISVKVFNLNKPVSGDDVKHMQTNITKWLLNMHMNRKDNKNETHKQIMGHHQ